MKHLRLLLNLQNVHINHSNAHDEKLIEPQGSRVRS